ncbi:hypothetical protein HYS50_03530 [Candidatus Woesearchaeota archaeon]|nr:hypothetical protein [Candidatus Woesearchaeota archaeon]
MKQSLRDKLALGATVATGIGLIAALYFAPKHRVEVKLPFSLPDVAQVKEGQPEKRLAKPYTLTIRSQADDLRISYLTQDMHNASLNQTKDSPMYYGNILIPFLEHQIKREGKNNGSYVYEIELENQKEKSIELIIWRDVYFNEFLKGRVKYEPARKWITVTKEPQTIEITQERPSVR